MLRRCFRPLLKQSLDAVCGHHQVRFQVEFSDHSLRTILSRRMASAAGLIDFIHSSPTPFHLVETAGAMLRDAGFTQLDERESWPGLVAAGGKYFYSRNKSTIVAFTVGSNYVPGGEFKIGVECYGGGLWHTWFDRDLTLAGCVIVENEKGGFDRRLIHIQKPLLRVPTLCIHLQSAEERKAFGPNKETHQTPILGLVEANLNTEDSTDDRHSPVLMKLLAQELGCEPANIRDLELTLADTQKGAVWGAAGEMLSSPRLDNQSHCYTGLMALLQHSRDGLQADAGVSVVICFDHEEIGSESAQGAGSPVMSEAVSRVLGCFDTSDEMLRVTVRKSFLISADVAHAIHPNYPDKHEKNHQPVLNKGTVIKTNQNQRYATNAETGFLLRELARRAEVPVQEFVVRNDCPCGSTIGPIVSGKVGIRTVDLGIPSLSMHSIRETMGCEDVVTNTKLFSTFFKQFADLDKSCNFN